MKWEFRYPLDIRGICHTYTAAIHIHGIYMVYTYIYLVGVPDDICHTYALRVPTLLMAAEGDRKETACACTRVRAFAMRSGSESLGTCIPCRRSKPLRRFIQSSPGPCGLLSGSAACSTKLQHQAFSTPGPGHPCVSFHVVCS